MHIAWRVLVALGGLLILAALQMDTTVGRVHNLGLLQQQQMLMILGCALGLAGVVLFAVTKSKQSREEEQEERARLKESADKGAAAAAAALSATSVTVTKGASLVQQGWSRVRRKYVLLAGVLIVGLTVLIPPYTVTDYVEGGVQITYSVRRLIGFGPSGAPFDVLRLAEEIFWEVVAVGVLAWLARK